jgi:hypothetical protein
LPPAKRKTPDGRAERSEPLEDEGSAGEQQVIQSTANDACAIRRVVQRAQPFF